MIGYVYRRADFLGGYKRLFNVHIAEPAVYTNKGVIGLYSAMRLTLSERYGSVIISVLPLFKTYPLCPKNRIFIVRFFLRQHKCFVLLYTAPRPSIKGLPCPRSHRVFRKSLRELNLSPFSRIRGWRAPQHCGRYK